MNPKTIIVFLFFAVLQLVRCVQFYEGQNVRPDLAGAATGHHGGGGGGGGHHGRVQIKVYRGPSEGHEHFAPHGYWVKQPADHHH